MEKSGKIAISLYVTLSALVGIISLTGVAPGPRLLATLCLWTGGIMCGLAIAHWDRPRKVRPPFPGRAGEME